MEVPVSETVVVLGTTDACVPSTGTLGARSDQCAGVAVAGFCQTHLFSLWPFD